MPDEFRFGRISPEILPHNDESILQFRAAKRIALKPAPPSVAWWKESLPRIMGGNNRFGTCGPTSYANFLKLCSAYTLGEPVILSEQEILEIYHKLNPDWNGSQRGDRGVVMSQLYGLMKQDGPRGVNLEDHFAVDPDAINSIRWSIRIFGPVAFGVLLTDRDLQRTRSGDPWVDVGSGDPSMGHAVTCYDYHDNNMWDVESWGAKQQISTDWLMRRLEECHGFIHPYQFRSTGLSFAGLDKESMKVDAGLI